MFTHVSLNRTAPVCLNEWKKQGGLTHVITEGIRSFADIGGTRVFLQQYSGRDFLIVHGVVKSNRNVWVSFQPATSGLHYLTSTKGRFRTRGKAFNHEIRPGYYLFYNDYLSTIEIFAKKNEEYKFMLIVVYHSLLKNLPQNISHRSPLNTGKFTDAISSLQADLINAPYLNETLHFFYENKVRDIVFAIDQQKFAPEENQSFSKADLDILHSLDNEMRFNPSEHRSLEKMSATTGLSKYKLKEGFKQLFGMGLFERLLYWRLELACKLLADTDKPIKEIAFIIGHKRITSFITMFRKNKGCTPREFRLQARKGRTF